MSVMILIALTSFLNFAPLIVRHLSRDRSHYSKRDINSPRTNYVYMTLFPQ